MVTGVIPDFLVNREHMLLRAQERIVTRDMHERKRIMFERADAFVALPGGIGTLEELVEQLTWAQLGRHKKPILIPNIERLLGPALRAARSHGKLEFIRAGLTSIFWSPSASRTSCRSSSRRRAPCGGARRRWRRWPPSGCDAIAYLRQVTASMRLPSGSRMKAA